eukprot:g4484.t1
MKSSPTKPHTAFTRLPVVDMALLFSTDIDDRKQVAASLDRAARDAGFFYLKGHHINPALIANLKQVAENYFSQSLDRKMANYIGLSQNHSGYVPQGEEQFYSGSLDMKEAYDIGFDSSSLMARFVSEASNQWPEDPEFKLAVQPYYDAMLDLSRWLFRAFALALNLPEETFNQNLSAPPSQLRLIHYFDNPDAKDSDSGIGAHTDYEFFTILLPTAPGLQVINGANEWISVPLLEDCFVINIGDMMQAVSNGHYVATSHRVRQVTQERYAFPFFCSLDYDTLVEPVPALKYNGEPAAHESITPEPIVCGDHLLAQTIQTFGYLKARLEKGEIQMPTAARELASFGSAALKEG